MGGRKQRAIGRMGRSWQFFLTVAIVVAGASYAYYSSDFYAQRSSGVKPAAASNP